MFHHLPISFLTAMVILVRMPSPMNLIPSDPNRKVVETSLSELNQFDTDVLERVVASYAVGMRRWTEYPPLSLGAGDEAKLWVLNRYVFAIPPDTITPWYNAAFRSWLGSPQQVRLPYVRKGLVLSVQKLIWPFVSDEGGLKLTSELVERCTRDYVPVEEFRSFRKRFERRPPGPRVALTYPPRQSSDTPNDRLRRAILSDNAAATKQALLDGADPNSRDAKGVPIILSVNHRYRQIMRDLLLAGANPNSKASNGRTILEQVIRWGCHHMGGNLPTHEDTLIVIEWLLLKGAKTVKVPIHDPSGLGIPCVEMRPKIEALYKLVAQAARVKPAGSQSEGSPNHRLRQAIRAENAGAAKQVLLEGADPNHRGPEREPIIFSVNHRSPQIMRDLLLAGANPNAKASKGIMILKSVNRWGCCSMGGMLPTHKDMLMVIEWLLLKGAKPIKIPFADLSNGAGYPCDEMLPKIQTLYQLVGPR